MAVAWTNRIPDLSVFKTTAGSPVYVPDQHNVDDVAMDADGLNDINTYNGGIASNSGANHGGAFWIKFDTPIVGTFFGVAQRNASVDAENIFDFAFTNLSLTLRAWTDGSNFTTSIFLYSVHNIEDGNWHRISFGMSSGKVAMFVDGSEVTYSVQDSDTGAGFSGVPTGAVVDLSAGCAVNGSACLDAKISRLDIIDGTELTSGMASTDYTDELALFRLRSVYDEAEHDYDMNDAPGVKPVDNLAGRNFLFTTGSPDNTGAGIIMSRNPPEDQGYRIQSGPSPFRYTLGNMGYAIVFENLLTEAEQVGLHYFYGTLASPGGALDLRWDSATKDFKWGLSGFADAGARFDFVLGRFLKVGEIISVACGRRDVDDNYVAAFETSEGDKGSGTRVGTAGRPGENRGIWLNSANTVNQQAHQKARRMATTFGVDPYTIADVEAMAEFGVSFYTPAGPARGGRGRPDFRAAGLLHEAEWSRGIQRSTRS